jgi:hypothetical protein
LRMVGAIIVRFSQSEIHFLMLSEDTKRGILDDHRICLRAAQPLLHS